LPGQQRFEGIDSDEVRKLAAKFALRSSLFPADVSR
jgi:hypothetical protein